MPSPTSALLWEIWRRHRSTVALLAVITAAGRFVDLLDGSGRAGNAGGESSPLTTLLGMTAFLLLLSVLNYTESSGARAVGQFPRRLFTLPVTSLRLVAVPVLAAIAAIELLYLLWMEPLSRGGTASGPFVAVLLAALVVFYLWALWTLERAGAMRLLVLGAVAISLFAAGLLPSFPPGPPPAWRSEAGVAALVAALALAAFMHAWRHVSLLRSGDVSSVRRGSLADWIPGTRPAPRQAFSGPEAAHLWYEWRLSGWVLPALVAGVVVAIVLPASWLVRSDEAETFRLLLAALAAPVVLAVPVGIAFSKPAFWSEDPALPAFVAVRPLTNADLVATKVKAAALSAALSWTIVLLFVAVWLSTWADVDAVSRLAIQIWAFHGQSVPAVYGSGVLVMLTGAFLTWRLLVARLWSGLSGMRAPLTGAAVSLILLAIAALVLDAGRLPRWLLDDPARLSPLAWLAAIAVVAKYWIAACTWRGVAAQHLRAYLIVWLAATAAFLTTGLVVWGIARIYLPLDVERARTLVVLLALLAAPIARVGLAPASLARNRHR